MRAECGGGLLTGFGMNAERVAIGVGELEVVHRAADVLERADLQAQGDNWLLAEREDASIPLDRAPEISHGKPDRDVQGVQGLISMPSRLPRRPCPDPAQTRRRKEISMANGGLARRTRCRSAAVAALGGLFGDAEHGGDRGP